MTDLFATLAERALGMDAPNTLQPNIAPWFAPGTHDPRPLSDAPEVQVTTEEALPLMPYPLNAPLLSRQVLTRVIPTQEDAPGVRSEVRDEMRPAVGHDRAGHRPTAFTTQSARSDESRLQPIESAREQPETPRRTNPGYRLEVDVPHPVAGTPTRRVEPGQQQNTEALTVRPSRIMPEVTHSEETPRPTHVVGTVEPVEGAPAQSEPLPNRTIIQPEIRIAPPNAPAPTMTQTDVEALSETAAPPSINVSIGRIEIRATSTPPSTPPSPSRPRGTMSLDEYLRRRRGGES